MTVSELAEQLNLQYDGEGDALITHACGIEGRDPHGISYVETSRFAKKAMTSEVQVFICHESIELPGKTRIFAPHPDMAIVAATKLLHPEKTFSPQIHSSFVQGADCQLGEGLFIGPNVVIGDRVTIGSGCILMAGVVIGDDCTLGDNCHLHPNVTLRDDTKVGHRVVINSGAVLGAEGYGYVTHEGKHHKIPQVGWVEIEDDVEIGACNTIDRGRFGVTRIARGTKMDNLVHIGHNVEIGEDALIVGMVGFAGSTKTGHNLTMGGQSMMSGHLTIGNNVTVSAKSLLAKSVDDGGRYSGIPARPHKEWLQANSYLYRIQELFQWMKSFKK